MASTVFVAVAGVVAKEAAECSRHEQLKLVHWYLVRIPRQDDPALQHVNAHMHRILGLAETRLAGLSLSLCSLAFWTAFAGRNVH